MSDVVTTQTATAQTNTAADATASQNAALEQLISSAVQSALQTALNPVHARISRIEKAPKTPEVETEPGTVREELAQVRADIAREREEARREKQEAAISTAIAANGVSDFQATLLSDHVTQKYAGQIKVEGKSVVWEDPVTLERKPLKDFVGTLLTGKSGDFFKPAAGDAPDTSGLGKRKVAGSQPRNFASLSKKEQDDLYQKDPDAARAMVKAEMNGQV